MEIQIGDPAPRYYGETGWHAFGVSKKDAESKVFYLDEKSPKAYLYKVSQDIAVYLSNKIGVKQGSYEAAELAIFGDAAYVSQPIQLDDGAFIVGYLSHKNVKVVSTFLSAERFNSVKGRAAYYSDLDKEVQDYMVLMFDDRLTEEVGAYVKSLTNFYKNCAAKNMDVVILYFP